MSSAVTLVMSASCLRWSKAAVQLFHGPLSTWRPAVFPHCCAPSNPDSFLWRTKAGRQLRQFSTDVGGAEGQPGRQRHDTRSRTTVSSVGRKIHHRHLQVMGTSGEDLGTMHRADVIRLMDQQGLKLVPLDQNQQPPVYRLMTGKQIHQEQLKLRESQKGKTGPVVVKELVFSTDISLHDLDTKLRQIQGWLDRSHHVRLTLKRGSAQCVKPLDLELEQMLQGMMEGSAFVSRPQLIRDGKAAMCILRTQSKREHQKSRATRETGVSSAEASEQSSAGVNASPEQ